MNMATSQHPGGSHSAWINVIQIFSVLLASLTLMPAAAALDQSREQVIEIVTQIQKADYEGNRSELKRLHEALSPSQDDQNLAAQVLYWRGFALWRRAINGFNDNVDSKELQEDLQQATAEFDQAARLSPDFTDAKIGRLSCLGILAFAFSRQDPADARITELITQARQLRKDIDAEAPDNPRFLWVLGPMYWNMPPQKGEGQDKAMELYAKGLDVIRTEKARANDPLNPSWGEPELLMSLAWSNLNRTTPDLNAATQDADAALKLVPYWHYVRDILLPQITEAKRKTGGKKPTPKSL
jgi:tetratricopeptide (TPR) repeat protein